jgi:hypothetical protein
LRDADGMQNKHCRGRPGAPLPAGLFFGIFRVLTAGGQESNAHAQFYPRETNTSWGHQQGALCFVALPTAPTDSHRTEAGYRHSVEKDRIKARDRNNLEALIDLRRGMGVLLFRD